ncbi:hypothetical protein J2S74_002186 [Evansella vedderi]|uniref:Bacterial Pleckstrin homology domain-containing protein n=1 Tax=Evansella vedderi TaxID=38282 RepID=A0ABT9ZU88_9BACI|nr:hypothetical protein [Evansella vedderi]MDQ0254807.1 hypothetical protein [Evansella vedderi]
MIKKADVLSRLRTLIGKELTEENLHEALYCEPKHEGILRRFRKGTQTYVTYKLIVSDDMNVPSYATITVPGNPHSFHLDLKKENGKFIIQTDPKINYTY